MPNLGGFEFGGIGSMAFGWATSMIFWAVVFIGAGLVFMGGLILRRNRRYEFPVLEIISLGQGKIRVQSAKAGWFRNKKVFFNLLDLGGEEELLCKGGRGHKARRILYASSTDYHDINGKRGIICKRKDDDPELLVPLNTFEVKNLSLLSTIAPADYRDAANKILEDKRKETLTWWDENKSTILMISTLIFCIIALIFIIKFAQTESAGWRDALANQCSSGLASTAP